MKTKNIDKQLRDYYHEKKNEKVSKEPLEEIDDNLIARYIEGGATTEEILKVEIAKKSDEELKMLLESVDSINRNTKAKNKPKISNIFSFSHPQAVKLFQIAACLTILLTGILFFIKSDSSDQPILLRGVSSHSLTNEHQSTNHFEIKNRLK
ncbi:MAG: hypothetical protein ACTSXL_02985 [Alphaproteobacteria bacterium]